MSIYARFGQWSRRRRAQVLRTRRLRMEVLERRALLATFLVTNTLDAGPGSLRQALVDANAAAEAATVIFNIPPTDPNFIDVDGALPGGDAEPDAWRIRPLTELPELNNPLFGITVDARTQTVFGGNLNPFGPEVILDGDGLFNRGFFVTSRGHTLAGFNIQRFGRSAIHIAAGDDNVVIGNYLGTDATGTAAAGNTRWGVILEIGASGNRVGTDGDGVNDAGERNVVSANGWGGVGIADLGSDNNVVAGNYIGTNAAGTAAIGNTDRGVDLLNGAKGNRIGTDGDGQNDAAEGNLISGNQWDGVGIQGEGTSQNVVAGNLIGTDVTGKLDLGNALRGVVVFNSASANVIGGGGPARRNIISGNGSGGVNITSGAFENLVAGNYVGTDITGTVAIANTGSGVRLGSATHHNTVGTNADGTSDEVEGNLISANTQYGVLITDAENHDNTVAGNLIGTDAAGMADLGNALRGVAVESGATSATIGGASLPARNVISGNDSGGVRITPLTGGASTKVVVIGNYIGTNSSGSAAIANAGFGILIEPGAADNRIGTDGDGANDGAEGNLISGNGNSGIRMFGAGTARNVVAGNRIGTNAAGNAALPNTGHGVSIGQGATNNRVGTNGDGVADELERNLISGNGNRGVLLSDQGTDNNIVAGNYIGTNLTATAVVPNTFDGVLIQTAAKANRVGTDGNGQHDAAEANVIAGNAAAGVNLAGAGTEQNVIAGNFIGTNSDGTLDLGNVNEGVRLQTSAQNNRIGGPAGSGNTIAFNKRSGIGLLTSAGTGNRLQGNSIYGNALLGIDLGVDGVSVNDAGDADAGPNNSQNSPVIAAVLLGRSLTLEYAVNSLPANAAFPLAIDVFIADLAGQEGQTLLRSVAYAAADATLVRRLSFVPPATLTVGTQLVATATDAVGNTSEFSLAAVTEDRVNPWHNPKSPLDVNDKDGTLASDALAVINYLNAFGVGFVPIDGPPGPEFYDTTNDGQVTAADALAVINAINAGLAGGEGEAGAAASERVAASDWLLALWPEVDVRRVRARN